MRAVAHRAAFLAIAMLLSWATAARSQDSRYAPESAFKQAMISGPDCENAHAFWSAAASPCVPGSHEAWLKDVRHWRDERRIRVGLDGARYADPAFDWTRSVFFQAQAMVEDRFLYDPSTGRYTVDRYLNDLERRFGGVDAVLIWPDYPNLGIDDRNQLDRIGALPGGLDGVRAMVAAFHRRGVKVFFPMMMWDQGTRPAPPDWPAAIASTMKALGADGVNGDTQDGVPPTFIQAAERTDHPLVFQPEGAFADEDLTWTLMSWGQYSFDFAPKVDRYKWLEPRHMVNISDRWAHDRTDDLQTAFFNGVGWMSWENIFGIWNGITPRDGEAARRIVSLDRALTPFLKSAEWEPFYPMTNRGVFASRWPGPGGQTLWTIVNRNDFSVSGPQMRAPSGYRYFDAYRGVELHPTPDGDQLDLTFTLEARGVGAILATPAAPGANLLKLFDRMRSITSKPLSGFDDRWAPSPQQQTPIAPSPLASSAPSGMVEIPAGRFRFAVSGVEIEGGEGAGVDVAYPWEDVPRRNHVQLLSIKRFFMDREPVSNRQFKVFMDSTGYHPRDAEHFLSHWIGGTFAPGDGDRPVTWVSIEDARAYAAWAGKRLPHEWEWQYAAQGRDGRAYPWGAAWSSAATPPAEKGRTAPALTRLGAHPLGVSPFGVEDLVGTVWQWTDEYSDLHTRAAVLRGGSPYQPQGSYWYFPQAYRNDEHAKLLLMSPGRDRSPMIGFRCVTDAD